MPAVELRPVRQTPPADALPRLRTFVSPFTGVIRTVAQVLGAPDEHRLVSIGCALADGRPTVGEQLDPQTGSEHWLRDAAEAAAIGEALERYSASYLPSERFVLSSADRLADAVDPERFGLFHDVQYADPGFPFRPFRREAVVAWVEGFALPSGRPVHLPAQLVFMPWQRRAAEEEQVGYTTSSGLACAATLEEAVLTGLFEQIERDAVMLAWYNRLSLPVLDWSRDPEIAPLDARYFAPTGLRYEAIDLSGFFGIPTVLGVVHGPSGVFGALGVGAATAATLVVAWRKALAEAFSVQRWVRDCALEHPDRLDRTAAEIRTFEGHTMFYADPARAERAAFLCRSTERRDTRDIAPLEGGNVREHIEVACQCLERRGASAYAVDVASPDVRAAGFQVVRVLSPELCQLDVVQRARFLGSHRLFQAAYEAGLVPRQLTLADINADPHPFP